MTVTEGADVFIPCSFRGVIAEPVWIINGEFHDITNPPPKHTYNSGWIISDVDLSMSLSSYVCILDLTSGEYLMSTTGFLIVTNTTGI